MNLAPIVLFVYNRPWHTAQTLQALAANTLANQSELIIYADGPKENASVQAFEDIKQTRDIIKSKQWCKTVTIIESEINKGLANSIIAGVTAVVNQYGKIIVLEDDLITSPAFLTYINDSLAKFSDNREIGSINAFVEPAINFSNLPSYFLLHGADCWGWATWKDRWADFIPDAKLVKQKLVTSDKLKQFDYGNTLGILDAQIAGTVNSWHIRWHGSQIINGRYGIYPNQSFSFNIGQDGSGTHGDLIANSTPAITDLNSYQSKITDFDLQTLLSNHPKTEKDFKRLLLKHMKGSPIRNFKNRVIRKVKSILG